MGKNGMTLFDRPKPTVGCSANGRRRTNIMYTFQITVLIQFLVSFPCFEHLVFIIRKTICTCSFMVLFHAVITIQGYI